MDNPVPSGPAPTPSRRRRPRPPPRRAAPVHSIASNAADRRAELLLFSNRKSQVPHEVMHLKDSLVIAALVASSTKTEPIFETARITASMCAEQRHRFGKASTGLSPAAGSGAAAVHSIAFSAAGRGAASVANGHRPRPRPLARAPALFSPWLDRFPIDSGSDLTLVREAWNVWREYPQWIFSKFISFSSCSANSLLASTVSRV
uniref:Uncharacterized protein n=1 Tax=Oryza meridionalis TaxID=40149 RepID=A0A0E0F3W1_9ORYZ